MDEQTLIILIVIGSILLISALLAVMFFVRRTVTVTVAGFYWFRKVQLEHYIWVEESSHYGFPAGSRNQVKTTERYQSYEQIRTEARTIVINGKMQMSTQAVYGYVTRTRTKYTYEIQKWVDSRALDTEGEERATLSWPHYSLDRETFERVKKTWEKYLVFFQNAKGKQYKRKLPEEEWIALDDLAIYRLKVNLFGQVKESTLSTEQQAEMPEPMV